jgi:hypothetical protein
MIDVAVITILGVGASAESMATLQNGACAKIANILSLRTDICCPFLPLSAPFSWRSCFHKKHKYREPYDAVPDSALESAGQLALSLWV